MRCLLIGSGPNHCQAYGGVKPVFRNFKTHCSTFGTGVFIEYIIILLNYMFALINIIEAEKSIFS